MQYIKFKNWHFLLLIVGVLICKGCNPNESEKILKPNEDILPSVPKYFPESKYDFSQNAFSWKKFELGRLLFYDPLLSRDNTISCGSCHQQFAAMAHSDHPVSHGIDNKNGIRNAPGLFNLRFKSHFFWDGGVLNLENQPIGPIMNPSEMDENLVSLESKLNNNVNYRNKFKLVFGSESITTQNVLKALACFMAVLTSSQSRYDQYISGKADALTLDEIQGLSLFNQFCGNCHSGPLFSDDGFHNNGLDNIAVDKGRSLITNSANDIGKFSTPSLRNVSLTSYYMHDGRFKTLEKVLEHYAHKIKTSSTLDTALKPFADKGMQLSADQQKLIVKFLRTLTDTAFINDARFSETGSPKLKF